MKAPGRPITRQCCGQLPVAARRLSSSQSQVSCVPTAAHVTAHCISALLLTIPKRSQVLQGSSPIQHRQQTPRATPLVRVCARCSYFCFVGAPSQSHIIRRWSAWSVALPPPRSPTRSAPDRHVATTWPLLRQWSSLRYCISPRQPSAPWRWPAQAVARVSAIATGPRPPPSSEPGTVGTDEPLRIELGDGPGEADAEGQGCDA